MKKKGILPLLTTWMKLEDITLNEISQTKEDRYHMVSFIYTEGVGSAVTENRTAVTSDGAEGSRKMLLKVYRLRYETRKFWRPSA